MTSTQKKYVAIGALSLIFFLLYSFLPLFAPLRFNSPDESANYFFSGIFREHGKLWAFDELNQTAPGLIHPRSIRVVGGFLVPVGFIGLPVIFGGIAKVFSMGIVPFMTPLAGVLGALAWGALVARIFGRRVGVWSALLLLVQPAWWYESSRVLMPNVLFAALAVAGSWFILCAPIAGFLERKGIKDRLPLLSRGDGALGGIFLALALTVRASEAYWFAIAAAAALIAYRGSLPWQRLIIAAVAAVLVAAPFLVMQQAAYGSPIGTGYGRIAQGSLGLKLPAGKGNILLGPLRPLLFPLGFAPRTAVSTFIEYGVKFFWGWSLLVGVSVGAGLFELRRRIQRNKKIPKAAAVFALSGLLACGWLVAFYGSWMLSDNPDPAKLTIGSSYLRYWLPVFVFSVVPPAWLFSRLRPRAAATAWCVVAALSGLAVFGAEQEGLLALRANLIRFDAEVGTIMAKTEPGSLIVVDRADKLLFPRRSVMYPLRDEATYAALPKLVKKTKVYYFGITFPGQDLRYLREEKLASLGLTIDPVVSFEEETLYELKATSDEGRAMRGER